MKQPAPATFRPFRLRGMRNRTARLATGLLVLGFGALAFSPREALAYRPPELGLLGSRISLTKEQEAFTQMGLKGSAAARYADDLSAELSLALELGRPSKLEAALKTARAERAYRQTLRDGIYRALKAHAALWKAEAGLQAARLALEVAQLEKEAATARGAGPLALEEAKNALEAARIALAEAELEAEAAVEETRALGFAGAAEPTPLAFALPPARADRTTQLELALADARVSQAQRSLFVLSAELSYQDRVALGLKAETAGPSIGVAVGPKNPLVPPGTWQVGVSARLSLDPRAWTQVHEAELAAREARVRAERKAEGRGRRLRLLRARAELGEKRLRLAQKRLKLAKLRLQAARHRWERGMLSRLELRRMEAARWQAEQAVAQAWAAYLEAVKAYLDLADGEWRVR